MEYYENRYEYTLYLAHHGIKGQRWGLKRFQNADRTWTEAGKIRYGQKKNNNNNRSLLKNAATTNAKNEEKNRSLLKSDKAKTALKIGAGVVATGLAVYGAKKLIDSGSDAYLRETGKAFTDLYMERFQTKSAIRERNRLVRQGASGLSQLVQRDSAMNTIRDRIEKGGLSEFKNNVRSVDKLTYAYRHLKNRSSRLTSTVK